MSGARVSLTADDVAPIWSRDGARIVFTSNRKGHFDLYEKAASGIGSGALSITARGFSVNSRSARASP